MIHRHMIRQFHQQLMPPLIPAPNADLIGQKSAVSGNYVPGLHLGAGCSKIFVGYA